MMTAWSFIFGVLPLVVASGAGANAQKAIGIATFSGMLRCAQIENFLGQWEMQRDLK